MTAPTAPLTRIPTATDIATNPIYTCRTWRDAATGLDLIGFLTRHVGPVEARRVLDQADRIVRGVELPVQPTRSPLPRLGLDTVWTYGGVDHDPVPARQVTSCGVWIPPPFIYQFAGGLPCPDCFGEPR